MKILFFFFILFITGLTCFSQPGYSFKPLHFQVFEKGRDVPEGNGRSFILEWRDKLSNNQLWRKANITNGAFVTDPLRNDRVQVELKIYRQNSMDTMYISCTRSLLSIPFQKGLFELDQSQCYLANMRTLNGSVILNQDWENFKKAPGAIKSSLIKKRYCYMSKSLSFMEEDEKDVQYMGYQKSAHLREDPDDGLTEFINLGPLYHVPSISTGVYSIGYVNSDEEDEKYSQYFLESTDGCRSWKIKFPLADNTTGLVSMAPGIFTFVNIYPVNQLLHYNQEGKLVDSLAIDTDACALPQNLFYTCDDYTKVANINNNEVSDPFMDNGSTPHLFHKQFTQNRRDYIRIDSLPFNPVSLSISNDNGLNWKKILELNSDETYAYLTMRKNKLVLLSYHYTMVSTDFGKSWTFYHNGTFNGGNWNFIWMDDNTLVNVTQYYADIITIL